MIRNHCKILAIALIGFSCVQHKAPPVVKVKPCTNPQWLPLGKGLDDDPLVEAMVVYNKELIVAGRFKLAGNVKASNIAKWDGQKWDSLGGGVSDNTLALGVYNNELYVGGWWKKAGSINVANIAKWDGKNWSAVGDGLDLYAQAFVEYKGELYAGGAFKHAGKVLSPAIARWNGKEWLSVGDKMWGAYEIGDWGPIAGKRFYADPNVKALCVYKGDLYVSGFFTKIGKSKISGFAKWDGENWSGVVDNNSDALSNVKIEAFAVYNGCLYMAGEAFNGDDYKHTGYVACWDGVKLTRLNMPFGDSDRTDINSMVVFDSALYVGGKFKSAGASTCNLAKWDGHKWFTVGNGMQSMWNGDYGFIQTTAVYNGTLYAGGLFQKAGNYVVNNIARFTCIDSTMKDINNAGGSNEHSATFGQK